MNRLVAAVVLFLVFRCPVSAGGPLELDSEGRPYRWNASAPVRFTVDRGPLGPHSHETAIALVRDAAAMWAGVPTARLRLQEVGEVTRDLTGSSGLAAMNNWRDGVIVVFDNDGSIIEEILGEGAEELGVGGPLASLRGQPTIVTGFVLLSGPNHRSYSQAYALGTAVHEWGHALGLDHSQLNHDQMFDGDPTNNYLAPMMSYSHGPATGAHLHADDRAWFSWLYPADGDSDAPGATGTIRGRVLLPDRVTGLRGINVIARRVGDPRETAVAALSGGLWNGRSTGRLDLGRLGEFTIPGLPPGAYTVELQELEEYPVVVLEPGALPGGRKFWREGSSPQDPPKASSTVMITAGQEVTGIDIVVNAEDLGAPVAVTEAEPNALPRGQSVTLPALISGEVEDADTAGPPVDDEALTQALHDAYAVRVREPTVLTAILTTPGRGVDLDLYLVRPDGTGFATVDLANATGTPPEILQVLVPAGRYYFGVRRAGERGSSYTLSLVATPAPEPETQEDGNWLNYLTVGDVTSDSAVVRWQTIGPAPGVAWFDLPLREAGSTTLTREHRLSLTDLTSQRRTTAEVFVLNGDGVDAVRVPFTVAAPPAAEGGPRLVLGTSVRTLDRDYAEVEVRLSNPGDGDARDVRIEAMTLASGWHVLSENLLQELLPLPVEMGDIGAGGAGVFLVRIQRWSGTAAARVTLHGTYTDGAGALVQF